MCIVATSPLSAAGLGHPPPKPQRQIQDFQGSHPTFVLTFDTLPEGLPRGFFAGGKPDSFLFWTTQVRGLRAIVVALSPAQAYVPDPELQDRIMAALRLFRRDFPSPSRSGRSHCEVSICIHFFAPLTFQSSALSLDELEAAYDPAKPIYVGGHSSAGLSLLSGLAVASRIQLIAHGPFSLPTGQKRAASTPTQVPACFATLPTKTLPL